MSKFEKVQWRAKFKAQERANSHRDKIERLVSKKVEEDNQMEKVMQVMSRKNRLQFKPDLANNLRKHSQPNMASFANLGSITQESDEYILNEDLREDTRSDEFTGDKANLNSHNLFPSLTIERNHSQEHL